jgi:hypothetical protein
VDPIVDARLFEQCAKVYEEMLARSQPLADGRVFRGYMTYLIEDLGYSISNYTPIMRRLRTMGCISQRVRGGRGTPSEWTLHKPPTRQAFARGGQRWVAQNERIADLEERVAVVEAQLAELGDIASLNTMVNRGNPPSP